ncbi:hypothetical protein HYD_6730 [Candidatus Hydrogenosomobacter endosymbioticus]|uniref:Uncharacterized protein n=2 Tax=Candidatus Hydrogenosomobacter endosymbioticus TaxID=2558174 RepID=A0ABM7V9U4_9PROT|nr:hypothetical protein HYD_6730 [Candidatus Hydrogenosomobacter endosymbioticus]
MNRITFLTIVFAAHLDAFAMKKTSLSFSGDLPKQTVECGKRAILTSRTADSKDLSQFRAKKEVSQYQENKEKEHKKITDLQQIQNQDDTEQLKELAQIQNQDDTEQLKQLAQSKIRNQPEQLKELAQIQNQDDTEQLKERIHTQPPEQAVQKAGGRKSLYQEMEDFVKQKQSKGKQTSDKKGPSAQLKTNQKKPSAQQQALVRVPHSQQIAQLLEKQKNIRNEIRAEFEEKYNSLEQQLCDERLRIENEKKQFEVQKAKFAEEKAKFAERKTSLENKVYNSKIEVSSLINKISHLELQISSQKEAFDKKLSKVTLGLLEEADKAKTEKANMQIRLEDFNEDRKKWGVDRDYYRGEISRLYNHIAELRSDQVKYDELIAQTALEKGDLQKKIEKYDELIAQTALEKGDLQKKIEKYDELIAQTALEKGDLQKKYDELIAQTILEKETLQKDLENAKKSKSKKSKSKRRKLKPKIDDDEEEKTKG